MRQFVIPEQAERHLVHFFYFPVFGNSLDHILSDGAFPAWKWVKPHGTYRKMGFWETELHEALEDGEWNGGKDLVLLLMEVSEQTHRDAKARGYKTASFARFLQNELGVSEDHKL